MSAVSLFRLSAQCDLQADFAFTITGCDVEFQPNSNGVGVSHFWTFQTTGVGFTSASNIATPLHTFGAGSGSGFTSRTVTHTVTINGIMYTCTKQIIVECIEGCDDKVFGYAVNGCTVSFDAGLSTGQNWDFGDGNTSTQTDPTHTYAANGDYTVTYSTNGGVLCQKTIRVACGSGTACCTAEFTGQITRECSVLKLELNAECNGNGTHTWSITPNVSNACMTLVNFFQGAPVQGMIQITNINTCVVTNLNITHQYTCPNGTVLTVTKSLNMPAQGIFIGKDGMTTNLTDYECVLPGAGYNGSCIVYSSGIVNVNKDFTFSSANVRVQPGLAGFDVVAPQNFTIRQGTTVSGNPDSDCNCLWRGITVASDAKLTTGSGAAIEDALYSIRAGFNSILEVRKTHFRRNFIGIRSTEGPFVMDFFEENEFDGTGPLKGICSLTSLNDIQVAPITGCQTFVPYQNERGFAGMYLRNAGNVNLLHLNFDKQNIFHGLAVGIDAYDTELNIRRNSRFQGILPGAYAASSGGVAVRFVDEQTQGYLGLSSMAGIYITDFTPTQSAPEISQNTIDVNQDEPCGSFGMRIAGFLGDALNQVNINRNEINVNQGAFGIALGNYIGAWVHDNSNAGLGGTGIFLNSQHNGDCFGNIIDYSVGISVVGNNNNLIGCNDVTSAFPNNRNLLVGIHTNGTFVRNNLTNGRYSALFRFSCTGTRFACNTMTNYTENGLRYEAGANTGPQGAPGTMTHGNRWMNNNPALIGAFADIATGVNPLLSPYFVRNVLGENPTNNFIGWFTNNVPNTVTPTCYYDCPITAPQNFAAQITAWDDSVATGVAHYTYYPEAARWIEKQNLYEKLSQNPALVAGSPVMESFMAAHQNTAMARLVTAVGNIGSLYVISQVQKSALESNTQTTTGLLIQLENLDSIIRVTVDPSALEDYKAQRDSLSEELGETQAESQTLAQQLTQQRLDGIPDVLAFVESIAPANVYEANEKSVLLIYLLSFVSGTQPTAGMLDTLYDIGSECPYLNGSVVYDARNLYEKFTGVVMPDVDCPEAENRSDEQNTRLTSNLAGIMLYPNPADGFLVVHLPDDWKGGQSRLMISNAVGVSMLDIPINPGDNQVRLDKMPSGVYFVRAVQDDLNVFFKPLLIQH